MKKLRKKKSIQEATYTQLLVGAILKFGRIDTFDFKLLIDIFKRSNIRMKGKWYDTTGIERYIIVSQDGTTRLREGVSLDQILRGDSKTVRENLLQIAGPVYNELLSDINVEKFKEKKRKLLENTKANITKRAKVLLISENTAEYDELVNYGFEDIDYFKSRIRASHYFAEHPEAIERYHIILLGKQSCIASLAINTFLENKIRNLRTSHVIVMDISSFQYHGTSYTAFFYDPNFRTSWEIKTTNYSDILDRIIERARVENLLGPETKVHPEYPKYREHINPNTLPLPTKKGDLKILYLYISGLIDNPQSISAKLGLNVTFREDSNYALKDYVHRHLGDYDIIIASTLHSSSLIWMSNESKEQCKDSGRTSTLLVTYNSDNILYFDEDGVVDHYGIGDRLFLNYAFGQKSMSSTNSQQVEFVEFNVLRQQIDVPYEDETRKKICQSEYSDTQAILEASLCLYNEFLIQQGGGIEDLDLRSADSITEEYSAFDKELQEKKELELRDIIAFDEMRRIIMEFLDYKNSDLIRTQLENLKIEETTEGICITSLQQGKTIASIVIAKEYPEENLRIFDILLNKRTLSRFNRVGFYTKRYNGLPSIPRMPNEKERAAISHIMERVKQYIKPLNMEAGEKQNSSKKFEISKKNEQSTNG